MFLAQIFGGWEVILMLLVLATLFTVKSLPPLSEFLEGLRRGIEEFRKASSEVTQEIEKAASRDFDEDRPQFSIRVFVAQGFGIGWIPFAPGTFGSFLGLIWFAMLVATGNFWAYLAGAIQGIAFSIWLCDDAEKILGQEDPGSVVLDEIIAIPFCFLPWVASEWISHGALPTAAYFFTGRALWMTLGLVALFRLFDIWKPWPVRQSQCLPGGWGVTVDDLLAAAYVALVSLPVLRWW
jgi:phosphatidylglycerophosphatase A